MAMIRFRAQPATDPNTGFPRPERINQSGWIVQEGTTTVEPIYEDYAKTLPIVGSSLVITSNIMVPQFYVEDTYELDWWDGTNRVPIDSNYGSRVAAQLAQAAAEDAAIAAGAAVATEFAEQTAAAEAAAVDAAASRAIVEASGVALPAGGNSGDVLYYAGDRTGQWLPAPAGGSGVVDWNVPGSILNKPLTFTPSAHNTTIDTLRAADGATSPLATVVLNLLKAASGDAIRTLIGAGTGNGSSNLVTGRGPGQAMPGDVALGASEITTSAISGVTGGNVQAMLADLATKVGTGGGGGGNVYTRDYVSGAYPVRGTLPAGAVVYWRGPVAPTIGGLYATSVDRWEVTA